MRDPHRHEVTVYYEDTDFSGVVYHANYLRYLERAREHLFGVDKLVSLWHGGVGFVVYRAELTYKGGAVHGDRLEIQTLPHIESTHRIRFEQQVFRPRDQRVLVDAVIELVTVDRAQELVRLPAEVVAALKRRWPGA